MIRLAVVGLGVLAMLVALAGFLRGLWASRPRSGASSAADWSSNAAGGDDAGHGGDAGHAGH